MEEIKVSNEEKELIRVIREIGWGTIEEVIIKDGQPTVIKRAWQTIKMDRNPNEPIDKSRNL